MTRHQLMFRLEQIVTVASLVLYSGGPLQVILSGGASQGDGAQGFAEPDYGLIRLLCMITYVIFGSLLVYRWKQAIYGLYKARFAMMLVSIALLSYFWSDYPSITMTRGIALLGTSLFGIYLGTRFTLRQQLNLLGWAFGIILFLSFLFIFAIPRYGIMGGVHAGTWRGIFTHKNVAGRSMVLGSLIFLVLASGAKRWKFLLWACFGLALLFIIMTESFTALTNFLFLASTFLVLRTLRWRYDVRLLTLLLAALVAGITYILIIVNAEAILATFDKDLTLTGRSDLWPIVIEMIRRRPWIGYGYNGFWQGINSEAGDVWRASGWTPPHSHNGFLDLTLDLGLITLGLFLFEVLTLITLALVRIQRTQTMEHYLCLLVPLFIASYSMTESTIMGRNTLFWVVFMAVAVSVRIPIPLPKSQSEDRPPDSESVRQLQLQRE